MLPFYVAGRQKEGRKQCRHVEKTHIKFQRNRIYFMLFLCVHDVTIMTSNVVVHLCFTSQKMRTLVTIESTRMIFILC